METSEDEEVPAVKLFVASVMVVIVMILRLTFWSALAGRTSDPGDGDEVSGEVWRSLPQASSCRQPEDARSTSTTRNSSSVPGLGGLSHSGRGFIDPAE